ncbi:MAG: hypothetical protein ACRDAM_09390, partial [Casimicrobium sp.]
AWQVESKHAPYVSYEGRFDTSEKDLYTRDSGFLLKLSSEILLALLNVSCSLESTKPLHSLPSNVILLSAIACMHRGGQQSDERAARALDELMERHKRNAIPFAWAAKQTFLRMWRGWAGDLQRQRNVARQYAEQSVEKGAATGLPFAIRAMISSHMDRNFSESRDWYSKAIEIEPNEPLIWLFKASLHTFENQGAEAADSARRALDLSPLDPISYYFKTLAAGAFLVNGEYGLAIDLAETARRENKHHHSTYRILALACGLDGQHDRGRRVVEELLLIDPGFSASQYLRNSPSVQADHYARIFRDLGAPN